MSNLQRHAIGGATIAVTGRLIRALQGIATLAILSRYLTPTEFGLMAMVAFTATLAQIFTDFGTRVALVQRRDVTRLEEDSVFWWNLGTGTILTALIMLFSAQIAHLMGEAVMQVPLLWVAPIFLIGALQGVPLSVLERRMAFGRIAMAEVGSAIAGSGVAVTMVLMGYRIEALVAQTIVSVVVCAGIIILYARWRPRFSFSYAALKPLLSYGGYVTSAGIVQALSAQADRPIVGNRLSATDLGYSTVAEQIVLSPLRITVQMVRKVMFPIMATIQDDNVRMRRGYIAMQHGVMVIMAPVCFGLWAVADPVVAIILGKGWEVVAVLMGYLTLRALFTTFSELNYVILSAKGWAKFQLKWTLFSAAVNIAMLLLLVDYGIEAVVAGKLATAILLSPVNAWFALRLMQQPVGEILNVLCRPLISAAVMGLAVSWLQAYLAMAGVGAVLQLLACLPVGALIYITGELLLDRTRLFPLLRQIRSRGKQG